MTSTYTSRITTVLRSVCCMIPSLRASKHTMARMWHLAMTSISRPVFILFLSLLPSAQTFWLVSGRSCCTPVQNHKKRGYYLFTGSLSSPLLRFVACSTNGIRRRRMIKWFIEHGNRNLEYGNRNRPLHVSPYAFVVRIGKVTELSEKDLWSVTFKGLGEVGRLHGSPQGVR
jgi:hypothetical protein